MPDQINPTVVPMLAYEDPGQAMKWLERAFGFKPRVKMEDDDGRVVHAEMEYGAGIIMLASPSPAYRSSRNHRATCADAARWLDNPYVVDGNLVHVDDVDSHFQRAGAAGATILSDIEDEPYGRLYRAEDLEGHRWMFMQAPLGGSGTERSEWVPPGHEPKG